MAVMSITEIESRTPTTITTETRIANHGALSAVGWGGAISASGMVASGETSSQAIEDAAQGLNDFFAPVGAMASARCIDGRKDEALNEMDAGPQLPGGTLGGAFAYRLARADAVAQMSFREDAREFVSKVIEAGFAPGDHRDDHATGDAVGCGALDKMDKALEIIADPGHASQLVSHASALLGDNFDQEAFSSVLKRGAVLRRQAASYLASRGKSVDDLEASTGRPVPVLTGGHKECFVIVNTVSGTTFATNRFMDEHGGIQAFNYDFWRTQAVAEALFSEESLRSRFVTARVVSAIATLMALTDGSQRLATRTPRT